VSAVSSTKHGVFAVLNQSNNKVFIGSGNLYFRKAVIWSLLRSGKHPNVALQHEWKYFGEAKFKFIPLFESENKEDISFMPECKRYWIWLTRATNKHYGYNLYKLTSGSIKLIMRLDFKDYTKRTA
jgi:hypothetical protein